MNEFIRDFTVMQAAQNASVTALSCENMKNKVHILSSCVFCVIVSQVEMFVNVRGSMEPHRGDIELLPVRDMGIEVSSIYLIVPEITVLLGPLCFL